MKLMFLMLMLTLISTDTKYIDKVTIEIESTTTTTNIEKQKTLTDKSNRKYLEITDDNIGNINHFDVATSDPPDFIDKYNIHVINVSTEAFPIITISAYVSQTTPTEEDIYTVTRFTTPKLPKHPSYTFAYTTDTVYYEPDYHSKFWSMFHSAGFYNSKPLGINETYNAAPEYGRRYVLASDAPATASDISSTEIEKPNNSDLTLETALGFNSTDNADNINFLDKVQKVIGNIKTVIERKSIKRRIASKDNIETFTDFIQILFRKLKKYDNRHLKYFVTVFNDEIRNYHYRGCKFHELLENHGLRKYLSSIINDIQMQSGVVIRKTLEEMANKLEKKKFERYELNLLDVINSVYRSDSIEKFHTFLSRIDANRIKTEKVDLVKNIKAGLRSIVFDHYSQLNQNARMALKSQVSEFWNNLRVSQNYPYMTLDTVKVTRILHIENNSFNNDEYVDDKHKSNSKNIRTKNEINYNILKPIVLDKTFQYIKNQTRSEIRATKKLPTMSTKLTFRTLYPDLLPEWTKPKVFEGRRQQSRRSFVHRQKAAARKSINKLGWVKATSINNKFSASIKGGIGSSKKTTASEKLRYKMPEKVSSLYLKKNIENEKIQDVMDNEVINTKKELEKHTNTLSTRLTMSSSDSSTSDMTKDSINSEDGMSIERYGDVSSAMLHRRSYTNYYNTTRNSTVTINSIFLSQKTPIVPDMFNTHIDNKTTIFILKPSEKLYDKNTTKAKTGFSHEQQKETVVQKRYHVKSRVEDKQLLNLKESRNTFDINNETDIHVKELSNDLNKDDTIHDIHNQESENLTPQRNNNKDSIYLYRSVQTSNKTLTDSRQDIFSNFNETTKNHDNSIANKDVILRPNSNGIDLKTNLERLQTRESQLQTKQNNDESVKPTDNMDLQTNTDFKSFIQDYENEISENKHAKETTRATQSLDSIVTKSDMKTENATSTDNISNTQSTIEVSKITIVAPSNIPTPNSRIKSIAPAYNIRKNKYLSQTNAPGVFDARFIKHLMKTTAPTTKTTRRTTTRESKIMGRYLNDDGVIFDSTEAVNKGLFETQFTGGYQDYDYSKLS